MKIVPFELRLKLSDNNQVFDALMEMILNFFNESFEISH